MGYKAGWLFLAVFIFVWGCKSDDAGTNARATTAAETPVDAAFQQEWRVLQQRAQAGNADDRLRLATLLDSAGRYALSLKHYDTLVAQRPGDARMHMFRAQTAENAGDTLEAFRSYDAAARIYPEPNVLLRMANLYAEMGNARSLQLANQVEKMMPDREYRAHARFVAAVYHARKQQYQQAILLLNNCLKQNYQYSEAYIEKALAQQALGQKTEALETLRFASSLNTLNEDYYYWMGYLHEQQGSTDSAVLRYQQALQLNPAMKEAAQKLEKLER